MEDGYESPNINLAIFSEHYGNNIAKISENECMWLQDRFDGICVSDRSLKKGDSYEVTIRGTGHLRLGLTYDLPSKKSIEEGLELSASVGNCYHIRMKEETEKITVEYLDKKIYIYTSHKGRESHPGFSVSDKSKHFLLINALFGKLDIELSPKDVKNIKKKVKPLKWCWTSGLNVLIADNHTRFSLRYVNPLGICALEQPLKPGKGFSVKMLEVYGSWHYLRLGLSNEAPEAVQLDNWRIFFDESGTTPWPKNIVHFLKVKCPQQETIMYFLWKGGNSILYQGCNGEAKNMEFSRVDTDRPIYVYLEPFRQHIQVDSRNNILEERSLTTYLTPIACDPSKTEYQSFSSQTKPFQLNSSIYTDPDQTCVKQMTESQLDSISDSDLFGPPAFNVGASDRSHRRSDPQEHRRSDPQEHTLDSSLWGIDPQEHGASGNNRSSDPLDIKATDLQEDGDGAGAFLRYSDPGHRSIFEQNLEPHETPSTSHRTSRSRGQSLPGKDNNRPENMPHPPPPTLSASSKDLEKECRVEFQPLTETDDQDITSKPSITGADKTKDNFSKCNVVHEMIQKADSTQASAGLPSDPSNRKLQDITSKPSITGADKTKDNFSKRNVVLEMIQKADSTQTSAGLPSDPSNHKLQKITSKPSITGADKTKDNFSKCNVVLEMIQKADSTQTCAELSNKKPQNKCDKPEDTEKMAQLPATSVTRNPSTEIPQDNKLKTLPNQTSKYGETKNIVRSATMPNPLTTMSEKSRNQNYHLRSHSEQRLFNQHSNTNGQRESRTQHLTTIHVQNTGQQTKTGAIPKHSREISVNASVIQQTVPVAVNHTTYSREDEEEKWKRCLQRNFTFFRDNVEPVHLSDKLYEKKCLSDIEFEDVTKEEPRNKKCREIIKILQRKHHCKHDILLCLDLTDHGHIAERLRKDYNSC